MTLIFRSFRTISCGLLAAVLLSAFSACGPAAANPISVETPAQTTAVSLTPPPQAINSLFGVPYYDHGTPMNPLTETLQLNRDVCSLLYDTLFTVGTDFRPEANLCASAAETDTGFVLTLREGVLFHDGTRLTANDVVYSLKLAMTNEASVYRDRFDGVSAIGIDAQNRIVLTVDGKRPSLLAELSIPIIKQGTGIDRDAVGTGRYCMVETDGQRYLVPNTAHFSGQSVGTQMTHMQLTAVADADSLIYGVASGNIDILRTADASRSDIVLHADADRYTLETSVLLYAGFGNHNAIFDHARIRTAAANVIRAAFDGSVTAAPMLFHPNLGYVLAEPDPADTIFTAEVLLATAFVQSGYSRDAEGRFVLADGSYLTLRLLYDGTDHESVAAAEKIAASFDEAGIAMTLTAKSGADFDEAFAKKQFDICLDSFDAGSDFDFTELLKTDGAAALCGVASSDLDLLLASYRQVGTANGGLIAKQIGERIAVSERIVPIGYRRDEVLLNRKFRIAGVKMTADDIFYNVYDWVRAK